MEKKEDAISLEEKWNRSSISCPWCQSMFLPDQIRDHVDKCYPPCKRISIWKRDTHKLGCRCNTQFITYRDISSYISDIPIMENGYLLYLDIIPVEPEQLYDFPREIHIGEYIFLLEYEKPSLYDFLSGIGKRHLYRKLYPDILLSTKGIVDLHNRDSTLTPGEIEEIQSKWEKYRKSYSSRCCSIL